MCCCSNSREDQQRFAAAAVGAKAAEGWAHGGGYVDMCPNAGDAARGERIALVSATLVDAAATNASQLERRTIDAYQAIADELNSQRARHAVRFWNYIPSIHARWTVGAIGTWCSMRGGSRRFLSGMGAYIFATCSNGIRSRAWGDGSGNSLSGGEGVGGGGGNPRQITPYRYSKRFGPLPPCFARATVVKHGRRRLVLVGGTASIRGEESIHLRSLEDQTRETLENLGALVSATDGSTGALHRLLARFVELRVYYPRQGIEMR